MKKTHSLVCIIRDNGKVTRNGDLLRRKHSLEPHSQVCMYVYNVACTCTCNCTYMYMYVQWNSNIDHHWARLKCPE